MDQNHRNDGQLPKIKGTPIRSGDKLASATGKISEKKADGGTTSSNGGGYGGHR